MRLLLAAATILSATLAGQALACAAVSFSTDIAPLLQRRCSTCHSEDNSKGKYRLDSFARLLKAGESDETPIVAGKPQDSALYERLIETDPTDRMPQKSDALPSEEIGRIEQWIAEGAHFDGGSPDRPLVELARGALLHPAPERYAHPLPINALAFSPDGAQIAVGGYYEVTIWNVADGSLARRIGGLPERITSLVWNPKRNLLAVAGGTPNQWGTVALADPSGATKPDFLCDLPETALCVAFNPEGSMLAAAGGDRTLRFFDTFGRKQTRVLRQHADWVQTVAFSRDGGRLVTASRDRTSRVFDAATGEMESTDTTSDVPLLSALFYGDTRVLSLDRGRTVRIFDLESHAKVSELKGFTGEPRVVLLWDGSVVTAGSSPLITIHQISDRQRLFTLAGHHDSVGALALSPDHTVLASGSADGEVLFWDLSCGTWLRRFVASPGW